LARYHHHPAKLAAGLRFRLHPEETQMTRREESEFDEDYLKYPARFVSMPSLSPSDKLWPRSRG
jgi:hypothetical protein